MADATGPGSLKVIVAPPVPATERALAALIAPADLRPIAEGAWIAYCAESPAGLRDRIASAAGGPVFVVEFERWSAHGDAVDPAWLLRRGH